MPTFAYSAVDPTGKNVKGKIEAESQQMVMSKLRERGYHVTGLSEKKKLMSALGGASLGHGKVKLESLTVFTRLLATMINAGIGITKALRILEDQTSNRHFKQVIRDITGMIESGSSFSEALKVFPTIFSEVQVGMVESGEATGRLNQILLQIAVETEKSAQQSYLRHCRCIGSR